MLFGRWASRASEAAFPNLRDGLESAWCPSITGATGATLYDLTGKGRDATLTNATISGSWGQSGGLPSVILDGVNDYLAIRGTNASYVLGKHFTVACWINTSATGTRGDIFALGGSPVLNKGLLFYKNSSNGVKFDLAAVSGPSSAATITSGTWRHIAATCNNGTVQCYVDGVASGASQAMSPNIDGSNMAADTLGTYIGLGGGGGYFGGSVDDLLVYRRALAPSEVRMLSWQRGMVFQRRQPMLLGLSPVDAAANDVISGAAIAGTPAATIVVAAAANNADSVAAIAGTPSASITVNATANNATASAPIAGSPVASIKVSATANGITSGTTTVGTPAAEVLEFLTVAEAGSASIVVSASSMDIASIDADALDMLVVIIAASNAGTSGASSIASVSDSEGNAYTVIATTNNQGAPSYVNLGTTLGIYSSLVTDALVDGTITVSLSPNTPEVSVIVYRVTAAAGSIPSVIGSGTGTTGNGTTQTITSDSIEPGDTILGATAIEYNVQASDDTDTVRGTWSTGYSEVTGNPSGTANQAIVGQWKSVTFSGTQTYNTYTSGSRDYATNWFSMRPVAVVVAVPNDVICAAPTVGTPEATITVNASPNEVTAGTPTVGEPESAVAEVVSATANSIASGTAFVGEPSASIKVNASASGVSSTPVVGSPAASMSISVTPDSIAASSPVVGTPAASTIVNGGPNSVTAGTPTAGTPSAGITCHFVANEVTCGIPFISVTPLVTMCIDARSVYVPGTRAAAMYKPGTRISKVYHPGSTRNTIYSPGATAGVYSHGQTSTQVGCHQ